MDRAQKFEALLVPHLHAAYNLARWLLRNDQDAQDAVQEAFLRAFRFFDSLRGDSAKPWLLGIVRNTCYTWLRDNRRAEALLEYDDGHDIDLTNVQVRDNPEALLLQHLEVIRVNDAIEKLPPLFREVLILRELEELSYEEIAGVADIPIGTVMSRLARARRMLRAALEQDSQED